MGGDSLGYKEGLCLKGDRRWEEEGILKVKGNKSKLHKISFKKCDWFEIILKIHFYRKYNILLDINTTNDLGSELLRIAGDSR